MAQIPIREYDVKHMLYDFLGQEYTGIQIKNLKDIEKLSDGVKYVIKPDMLFGKRGKRGLLGLNLDKNECKTWLKKHFRKQENIDGVEGTLDIFMAEEFVKPSQEYYLSFSQGRDGDSITYSSEGGVEIEDNWDNSFEASISVSRDLNTTDISKLNITDSDLKDLLKKLWSFYRSYGFVSLEFNPIARDNAGKLVLLDAVAKIDDCEWYRQKNNWKNLEIPNTYGFKENAAEKYIRKLDSQTGASLKMKILSGEARIWTLFAGGGGSLVMTDTLGALGYTSEIGNYGECSGNPSREFTREYTKTLLGEMLKNSTSYNDPHPNLLLKEKGQAPTETNAASSSPLGEELRGGVSGEEELRGGKYLIIGGAIANFTHVDKTFQGMIDALEERQEDLQKQNVKILVRRGGIHEKKGLKILEEACKNLKIPAIISGSDAYMTDILREIKL